MKGTARHGHYAISPCRGSMLQAVKSRRNPLACQLMFRRRSQRSHPVKRASSFSSSETDPVSFLGRVAARFLVVERVASRFLVVERVATTFHSLQLGDLQGIQSSVTPGLASKFPVIGSELH